MDIQQFFTDEFIEMAVRFIICTAFNWLIIDRLYYQKSKRRDFYFTFLLTSIAIFFLVFYMIFGLDKLGGKTSMGIGIGLFGIFSIMRYRTDAMPVREMTYLFVIISLSVINAIASSVTPAEIIVTDFVVAFSVWICEKRLHIQYSKLVQYDRVELVKPERYEDLKKDIEQRLGLDVIKIEVGAVDFLRDMAVIRVYYRNNRTHSSSVDHKLKFTKEDLTTV